jgi:hypothetical protein
MTDLSSAAEGFASEPTESASGWFQASMNIIIKCDREDLRLKFNNHFVEGGSQCSAFIQCEQCHRI